MSELKFNHVDYVNHNTKSINIENGSLNLGEDYDIIKVEETKYGSYKATIKLDNQDIREKVKSLESQINDKLKSEGVGPVTILYGNKIYPKTSLTTATKKKENYLTFKSVCVNDKNKPFIQLWY